MLSAVHFALEPEVKASWDSFFLYATIGCHGITSFTISYALHCHLKLRKAGEGQAAPIINSLDDEDNGTDRAVCCQLYFIFRRWKPVVDRYVLLYALLLLFFISSLILLIWYVPCPIELKGALIHGPGNEDRYGRPRSSW